MLCGFHVNIRIFETPDSMLFRYGHTLVKSTLKHVPLVPLLTLMRVDTDVRHWSAVELKICATFTSLVMTFGKITGANLKCIRSESCRPDINDSSNDFQYSISNKKVFHEYTQQH